MLTVLRINRGWMEYMRAHHAEEAKAQAKQPFNKTVVDDADDAAAGPSAAPSAAAPAPAAASAGDPARAPTRAPRWRSSSGLPPAMARAPRRASATRR